MEVKKSSKANLENKKTLFLEMGFIFTLLIVFCAFQYNSAGNKAEVFELGLQQAFEEVNIPVTIPTPPPPPEQPQPPAVSDIIDIMPDDLIVDNNVFNTENIPNKPIEIIEYVTVITEEVIEEAGIPIAFVEEKPLFMGGDANNFTKWVNANMEYPELARANGVQGRVTIEFTVMTDGSVANIKVLRGVDSSLDKEAVRIVSMSPKWTPGKQKDKAVKVIYRFPVVFQLQ